jgi:hypothetical protein
MDACCESSVRSVSIIPHIFKHLIAGFADESIGLNERININSLDELNGGNMHRGGQTQRVKMQ